MRSIKGGKLGWNIEIYSTPTNQFDWSVLRAYVINIYISREISIEHPSVGLASLAQSREISIEHPSVGLASLAQLTNWTRKMVPIKGRASS